MSHFLRQPGGEWAGGIRSHFGGGGVGVQDALYAQLANELRL